MKLETPVIVPASVTEDQPRLAPRSSQEPPNWLRFLALGSAAGVLCFGLAGLALAIKGWYTPVLAFSLGTLAWIGVMVLAWPTVVGARRASRQAHVVAALAVAAVVMLTAWNAAHDSQHVLLNRDGGSYATTGRWIARTGTLEVKPQTGPIADAPAISFSSLAVYDRADGSLQFQFAHLLPVLLAEAYAIGGDRGLFHAPEVLGGIALLAFFVLAWRVMRRPWFALAATLALAFLIPQISFSRDSYSEIPSQILLFTGLWLLVSKTVLPRWRLALAAGLFLGALQAVRIDAIVFLIGVPPALALAWLRAPRPERRTTTLPAIIAFVVGLVPGMAIGLVDLLHHSGTYYSDLWKDSRSLIVVALASGVACALFVAGWEFVARARRRRDGPAPGFDVADPKWNTVAWVAALAVVVIGFGTWALRPRLQTLHGDAQGLIASLQLAEHHAVDLTRNYYEYSMTWMSWYLGPLTLGAAIVGAALLVRALLTGRMYRVAAAAAVIIPGSLLYLYRASAVSDQVWVTRRFLVSSFPTLILLAVGLAAFVWGLRSRSWVTRTARALSVVIAVGAVAWPIYTVAPVAAMQEKHGFLQVVKGVCNDVGPNAVVVVLRGGAADLTDQWIPQTLRSWCGAQVGAVHGVGSPTKPPIDPNELRQLAQQYRALGRELFVVASSPDVITRMLPDARPLPAHTATDRKELRRTLTHRPDDYMTETYSVTVARVPVS